MTLIEWISYFIIGISWVLVVGSLGGDFRALDKKNRIENFKIFFIVMIVTAICALLLYFIDLLAV